MGYDYAQAGAYYITVVTYQRACLFGHIVEGEMELDEIGRIVEEQWLHTAEVRPNIELDEFVIMPNHFHGIIVIVDDVGHAETVGASRRLAHDVTRGVPDRARVPDWADRASRWLAPTKPDVRGPSSGSIGAIMAQFKSVVTKHISRLPDMQGVRVWQRNYFEHIIRDDRELDRIRAYIAGNPSRWAEDDENPNAANRTKKSAS
jgi:REP element-mobilizing transposase RayT